VRAANHARRRTPAQTRRSGKPEDAATQKRRRSSSNQHLMSPEFSHRPSLRLMMSARRHAHADTAAVIGGSIDSACSRHRRPPPPAVPRSMDADICPRARHAFTRPLERFFPRFSATARRRRATARAVAPDALDDDVLFRAGAAPADVSPRQQPCRKDAALFRDGVMKADAASAPAERCFHCSSPCAAPEPAAEGGRRSADRDRI